VQERERGIDEKVREGSMNKQGKTSGSYNFSKGEDAG
jgi:hypothetical protein